VLRCHEGSASTTLREEGFLEAIARHQGLEVVSKSQHGGVTTESALRASEDLLASLRAGEPGGRLDGLFCPNESTTLGMLRALEERRLAGRLPFVGFDASKKLVDALAAGQVSALVSQDPGRMGELAVRLLADHLAGRPIERRVALPATVVTGSSMKAPEAQRLLAAHTGA
jgi:ribose transport system substrate-binding protein